MMRSKLDLQALLISVRKQIAALFTPQNFKRTVVSILLLGLVQAVLYAVLIPPWWHYDEPGHFEYAWLAANLPAWPKVGQYDQGMRREMGNSLLKYGWYQIRNFHPDLKGPGPIVIGIPQVGDPPGYYFLASLPLRFMHGADILVQYYAARAVSFLLFLFILIAAWYALGEILSAGHPLRWMVPGFLALLPAFVDTMTSVSNDVSAVLAATLFLWASLKLLRRGYSIGRTAFLVVTLAFCYLSKNTSWFAFLVLPLVLLFSVGPGQFTRIKLGLTGILVLVVLFAALQWGSPLAWYQEPGSSALPRVKTSASPASGYAFEVGGSSPNPAGQLVQFLTPENIKSVRGQTVTLGVWIWASHATQMGSPTVRFLTNNGNYVSSSPLPLSLTTQPVFFHQTIAVPPGAYNAAIYIQYPAQAVSNNQVFVNGLVLTLGNFSSNPPRFNMPGGTAGTWDNQPFQNLVRNGSAEQAGLRFRPWVERVTSKYLTARGFNLPLVLVTLQDGPGSGWYYRDTISTLFRTFWASLAGDKVPLQGHPANIFLILITILGVGGAIYALWIKRQSLRWDMVIVLGLSLGSCWIMAATRGATDFVNQNPLYPWARYAYPAILPTALLLCAGWLEVLEFSKARLRFTDRTRNSVFLGALVGLSVMAMLSAIEAFHPDAWGSWGTLVTLLVLQGAAILMIRRIPFHPSDA